MSNFLNTSSTSNTTQYISVEDSVHDKWLSLLQEGKILYLHGTYGSGKTLQAINFAKKFYKEWEYFSCLEENFFNNIESYLSENCFTSKINKKHAQGQKMLTSHTMLTSHKMLVIDDIQALSEITQQKLLSSILIEHNKNTKVHIFIIGEIRLPEYLVELRLTQRIAVLDRKSLVLELTQIVKLLSKQEVLSSLSKNSITEIAKSCLELTQGYPLFVQIYLQYICEYPNDIKTVELMSKRDVCYQLDTQFSKKYSKKQIEILAGLSIFSNFTYELAEFIFGDSINSILNNAVKGNIFLEIEMSNQFNFHKVFEVYFKDKFDKLPQSKQNKIYELTANYYENKRDFEKALYCYKKIEKKDKITQIIIYILENADGCKFAQLSEQYIDMIDDGHEQELKQPSIIGAKAMLFAYKMQPNKSRECLDKLKKLTQDLKGTPEYENTLTVYVRTLIANPCVTADELKENLLVCGKYGIEIKNIMPTSNSSSFINGGIDLLDLIPNNTVLMTLLKPIIDKFLGVDGVGVAEGCFGELLYEQNKKIQAMSVLTRALSKANLHGNLRTQYAINGIMARVLQSEGQSQKAEKILINIYDKAVQQHFIELLPNIQSSMVQSFLLNNQVDKCVQWLNYNIADEHKKFYITMRYELLVKAKVYIALDKLLEALYIIDYLEEYAILYHRVYLQIELLILKSIVLFRSNEDWHNTQNTLIQAVKTAQKYKLIRVFADQGVALLPLWKSVEWNKIPEINVEYVNIIKKNLVNMSNLYPKYLQVPKVFGELTDREIEVLQLLATGDNNTKIADNLKVSLGTVKFHVSNIIKKLSAENRTEAVKIAQEEGLI